MKISRGTCRNIKMPERRSLMKYTKEDILRIADEENVSFIRLQFTDILGSLKNVAITRSQLEKALNNKCMFDGSSIEGFVRIEESDMYLHPDLDTFVIFPWRTSEDHKVARLICDVYCSDGTPFEGDPRYVLRRAIKKAADMGYSCNVGPECEFFLFHIDENGKPTTQTHDQGGYFDLGPVDRGENCRRDICLALEEMGFEIEASHHEVAEAQHEIDFKYDEVLTAADNVMTFKYVVKSIAQSHGLHATFMPKPIYGISGSGMHTNISLFKAGENAFCDENDSLNLSKTAYSFIAGVLEHIRPMNASCPAMRLPYMSPGRLRTAARLSEFLRHAASAPVLRYAAPTRRATPILRWLPASPPVSTASSATCLFPRRLTPMSMT